MNCKPGDLAVVVRAARKDCAWTLGMIVRVSRHSDVIDGAWMTTPVIIDPADWCEVHFYDQSLHPIRPKSDDADCNSKAWLPPVPHKEVA